MCCMIVMFPLLKTPGASLSHLELQGGVFGIGGSHNSTSRKRKWKL